MTAVSVGTHVIKSHVCCSFLRVGLEEDRLPVATPGAGMVLRPGHRRVLDHVGVDVAHLIDLKQPRPFNSSQKQFFRSNFTISLEIKNGTPVHRICELNVIFPRE